MNLIVAICMYPVRVSLEIITEERGYARPLPPFFNKNNVADWSNGSVCDCIIVILTCYCPSTLIMAMLLRHGDFGPCPMSDLLVNLPIFRNSQNTPKNCSLTEMHFMIIFYQVPVVMLLAFGKL